MERMPLNWVGGIPPITKIWTGLVIMTSILIDTKLINTTAIIWLPSAIKKKEYWRLLTCFLYFGKLDVNLLMVSYNVSQYSSQLEQSFVKTKNYLWFLFVTCSLLLLYSNFIQQSYILGPNLVEVLTYIWGRKNPDVQMGLFGLIEFRAGYYAIFTMIYSIVSKQSFSALRDDVPTIVIGHLIFYLTEVFNKVHKLDLLAPPWEWGLRRD